MSESVCTEDMLKNTKINVSGQMPSRYRLIPTIKNKPLSCLIFLLRVISQLVTIVHRLSEEANQSFM